MLRTQWLPLLVVPALVLWGCGGDSTDVTPPPLTPSVSAISPTSVVAGSADLPLTITGHYFVGGSQGGSQAAWVANGSTTLLPTNFVSSTRLTALIPAALLSRALSAQVLVQTGDSTGDLPVQKSNALSFTVTSPPPKGGGENIVTRQSAARR
jgi:IPT/TIG domain